MTWCFIVQTATKKVHSQSKKSKKKRLFALSAKFLWKTIASYSRQTTPETLQAYLEVQIWDQYYAVSVSVLKQRGNLLSSKSCEPGTSLVITTGVKEGEGYLV